MSPEEGWGGVRRGIPLVLHPSNCTLKQINHTQTQTLCLTWLEKPPNITRPVTFSLAPSGDTRSPTQPQNDKKKVTRAAIEAVLSDYWEVSELLRELLSLLRLQVNGYACKWILIEMSDSVYRAELLNLHIVLIKRLYSFIPAAATFSRLHRSSNSFCLWGKFVHLHPGQSLNLIIRSFYR